MNNPASPSLTSQLHASLKTAQPTVGILEFRDINVVLDPLRTTVHQSCLFNTDGIRLPAAGRATTSPPVWVAWRAWAAHLPGIKETLRRRQRKLSMTNVLAKDFLFQPKSVEKQERNHQRFSFC